MPDNTTVYRAVKNTYTNDVIAIGCDEDQGGKKYDDNGGVWCDFTFTEMPTLTEEVSLYLQDHPELFGLKVVNDTTIVAKTLAELKAEIK